MGHETSIHKTASNDYDAVLAQLEVLRGDIATLAGNVRTLANTGGHMMAEDMTYGMNEAVGYLGRKGRAADRRIEGAVADNPYVAIGLAAGMGVLLGAMARRQ